MKNLLGLFLVLFLSSTNLSGANALKGIKKIPRGKEKIILSTSNEDIRTILETIAKQTNYNIVIPEDIQMKITVSLQNVVLEKALDAILLLNGLNYIIQDKTILVFSEKNQGNIKRLISSNILQTKVFNLQFISVKSITKTVEGLLSPRGKLLIIPFSTEKGWKSEENFLTNTYSQNPAAGRSSTSGEDEAYRFLVIDEQKNIDTITSVIKQIDVSSKQVYISTVIFEMKVSEEEAIGFKWTLSGQVNGSGLPWNFPFGHSNLGGFTPHIDPDDDYYPGKRPGMFPNADSSNFLFGQISMSSTQLLFELNRLGANLNLLSNPRLMVTDREEAVILVGEKYPVLRSTVTDQGTVTETFDRYEPIGVQLRVKPHILDNGEISMLIEPQVTSVGSVIAGTTGLSYPRISTRRIESKIRVADGESIIIAGLVSENQAINVSRVPILSDIPLLGYLFRHRATSTEKVDLVVVVTPYIDHVPNTKEIENELKKSGFEPTARTTVKAGKVIIEKRKKKS